MAFPSLISGLRFLATVPLLYQKRSPFAQHLEQSDGSRDDNDGKNNIISHSYNNTKSQSDPHPPVKDQSWKQPLEAAVPVQLVGESLAWLADQNQPLMFLGKNWGWSQPSKSHRRPEVQKYFTSAEGGERKQTDEKCKRKKILLL